jgi:hypothetical protein
MLLFGVITRFCCRLSRFAKMLNTDRCVVRHVLLLKIIVRRLLSVVVSHLFISL